MNIGVKLLKRYLTSMSIFSIIILFYLILNISDMLKNPFTASVFFIIPFFIFSATANLIISPTIYFIEKASIYFSGFILLPVVFILYKMWTNSSDFRSFEEWQYYNHPTIIFTGLDNTIGKNYDEFQLSLTLISINILIGFAIALKNTYLKNKTVKN